MKLIINDYNIQTESLKVEVNLDKLTRQFTFTNVNNQLAFAIDDKVIIHDNDKNLLIEGTIEYIEMYDNNQVMYAGRNNAKYIVDCYAEETIQFSESQSLQTILENIASKFNLQVNGQAQMPKNTIKTIVAGEQLGRIILDLAKSTGQIFTSDAKGNIEIEGKPEDGNYTFEFGNNVRSRHVFYDTTHEYDKYTVISQSNYLKKQEQEVEVKGEYGDGKFVKVIVAKDNLDSNECEQLAKLEFKRDRRKSFQYIIEVDNNIVVDVNKKYEIIDKFLGIKEIMKLKKYLSIFSIDENKLILTFEKIIND